MVHQNKERIGGYVTHDYQTGYETIKGGRIEEISYYKINIKNKLYTVTPHVTHSATAQQSIYKGGK